ncbi:MAG: double zinc ribbon domain-containing protein [Elusimicrobia bacterium]|nr:double zinc ribbon domain-containing protein [Elusimicrobiota bacterium]
MGTYLEIALDLLLPRACAHCREDLSRASGPLCRACAAALPPPPEPACVRCAGRRASPAPFCADCAGRRFSCRLIRAAAAHRGPAASLVHAFKFRGSKPAARAAGRSMAAALTLHPELSGFDALAAVPIHPRRERERGYNQAELLAREVAAATGLPLLDALERARAAAPSWRLGRVERRAELSGAYAPREGAASLVAGKRVLLIDDVATTGTTFEECASALLAAGATDAAGYAFARAGDFT